ncbi:MAG TPA: universal stress protein [Anaerolineales bacterium]|nr:universal stress protein [Anaerolineales bacterium]
MFDPILVPLDGSQLAECVLPHVVAMGQAFNAKIMLLHVLDKNQAGDSPQLFDLLNWQINKTEAKLYLERIGGRLQKSGLRTEAMVLEGPLAESITEFAQSREMKLVILSSHGRSGLRKWAISSITHKVILSAPTSVLIVRAPWHREQPYGRILVPLDGSWRAENVLPMVTPLARYHKSQIQIVHVVKTPEMARHMPPAQEDIDLSNQIVARNREEALHYLEQVQLSSPLAGVNVQAHLLISDNATLALHELVDREQIDMVALSAHGYSGNHQWPYGSTVNNFILYGKVPLLIVQDLPVREETSQVHMTVREHSEH